MQSFEDWRKDFLYKQKVIDAFEQLGQCKDVDRENYPHLRSIVIEACYNALRHKNEGDTLIKARKYKRAQVSNVDDYRRAINAIVAHIEGDKDLATSIMQEGMFHKGFEYDKTHKVLENLLCYLDIYREGLDSLQITGEPSASFYDTCQEGNIIYWNRVVDKKKRLDTSNRYNGADSISFLIFELATYFKLWTQKKGQCLFNNEGRLIIDKHSQGTATPSNSGRPMIPVITLLVNCTFGETFTAQKIKSRYEKLPKEARLVEWFFEIPPEDKSSE